MTSSRVVVASYNVHRCVGADGREDPRRVASVVQELRADVIGLQEVARGGPHDQLAFLAQEAGFAWLRGPTLRGGGTLYGNGLLTRLPVRNARLLDLSVPGREPRGAIDAELACGATRVRVVVTHLGLASAERRVQCERLLDRLEPREDELCILMGDFNEWWIAAPLFERLRRLFGARRGLRSFPAAVPLLALDRIWVRPGNAMRELRAHRSPLARRASDHLPMRAVVELPTSARTLGDSPKRVQGRLRAAPSA